MSPLLITADVSKVPFYILGGVLVVWAVALAGIGLQRPDFPYDIRGQRAVVGLTVALVVCAVGAAILTG
jgi:hypothetical protein